MKRESWKTCIKFAAENKLFAIAAIVLNFTHPNFRQMCWSSDGVAIIIGITAIHYKGKILDVYGDVTDNIQPMINYKS